jgi:hypothetical protein
MTLTPLLRWSPRLLIILAMLFAADRKLRKKKEDAVRAKLEVGLGGVERYELV